MNKWDVNISTISSVGCECVKDVMDVCCRVHELSIKELNCGCHITPWDICWRRERE